MKIIQEEEFIVAMAGDAKIAIFPTRPTSAQLQEGIIKLSSLADYELTIATATEELFKTIPKPRQKRGPRKMNPKNVVEESQQITASEEPQAQMSLTDEVPRDNFQPQITAVHRASL